MLNGFFTLLRLPSYAFVLALVVLVATLAQSSRKEISFPAGERWFEQRLSREFAGAPIDLAGTSIKIDLSAQQLFVRAQSITIGGLGHAQDTVFSRIGASFYVPDLIRLNVDPLSLTWGGVDLDVVVTEQGELDLGLLPTPGSQQDVPFFLTPAFASAGDTPLGDTLSSDQGLKSITQSPLFDELLGLFPNLTELKLEDTNLSFEDRKTGFAGRTVGAGFELSRDGGKLAVALNGPVEIGNRIAPGAPVDWHAMNVNMRAAIDQQGNLTDLRFLVDGLVPGELRAVFPELDLLQQVSTPITLDGRARFDAAGEIDSLSGQLDHLLKEPLSFSAKPQAAGGWALDFLAQDLVAADEPFLLGQFDFLGAAQMPMSGSVQVSIDAAGELQEYSVAAFQTAPGRLNMPDIWTQPQQVRGLSLIADGDLTTAEIQTSGAEILAPSGWQPLALSTRAVVTTRQSSFDIEIQPLGALSVPDVAALWPDTDPQDQTRAWFLENVAAGSLSNASMELNLVGQGANSNAPLEVSQLRSRFDFADARVQVSPAMGWSQIASGNVDISGTDVRVTGTSGSLGPMQAQSLQMTLDFADPEVGMMAMEVGLASDGPALVRWLAAADLGLEDLPSSLPLEGASARVSGQLAAEIALVDQNHPASARTQFDFAGQLGSVFLPRVLADMDVRASSLRLSVDSRQTQLSGQAIATPSSSAQAAAPGAAAAGPIQVNLDLNADNQTNSLNARGDFVSSAEALRPFVAVLSDYMNGRVEGRFVYRQDPPARSGNPVSNANLDVTVDLTGTRVDVPFLYFVKPDGRQAQATASVQLRDNQPLSVSRFSFNTADASTQGQVRFDPAQPDALDIEFDGVVLNRSRIEAVSMSVRGEQTNVFLRGGVVDATPMVEEIFGSEPGNAGQGAAGRSQPQGFGLSPTAEVVVRAENIAQVWLPKNRRVDGVTFSLQIKENGIEHMRFRGLPPSVYQGRQNNFGYLNASIQPDANGYLFTMTTDDAGAALFAFDLNDSVRLGRLAVQASSPLRFPFGAWRGRFRSADMFLFNAPLFGQLLQVASLTGIGEILSGTGIQFSEIDAGFTMRPGYIHLDRFQMLGPSVGMTGQGSLDFDNNHIDLRGTVTPFGAINEITQQLPLIDTLINGLDGGGLFSAPYAIAGEFQRPTVLVNPWAALTPGAFRDLYRELSGSF